MSEEQKKKREFYKLDRILATDCEWLYLIGGRNIGKSYAVKYYILDRAWNKKENFVYLRRWSKDIKQNNSDAYFMDLPIHKITKGAYIGVTAYHGYFYWYNLDEDTNKIIKSPDPIGRYCALNESARYKSQVFKNIGSIVYEEVVPDDNMYIDDEPNRLQNFISTVLRSEGGRVFMIGNTLSRVSPYVKAFCLDNFLHMKQGDIDIYNYHVDDKTIRMAVEFCSKTNYENKMFFGKSAKQILNGEWDVSEVNKLPKDLKHYENVYIILIEYQNFKFILNLLVDPDNGGRLCYIYPYTHDIDTYRGFRILTDRFSTDPFISARLDSTRVAERYIKECFALNKLCYSDNLTGADFKAVNEHFKISSMFDN